MILRNRIFRALAVALLPVISGCAHVGPSNLSAGRVLYNEALQRTDAEQLLLNIVRQRYNDPVLFLEVTGITSNSTRTANAELGGFIPFVGNGSLSPTLGAGIEEKPLIFYAPSTGEKFVRQVLTPIDLATLTLVLQAGWSIERVLLVAGESINGIRNSMAGAAPYRDYRTLVSSLRDLQRTGDLTVGATGKQADGAQAIAITLSQAARETEAYRTACTSLAPACDGAPISFRQGIGASPRGSAATIATRSLYSAIYFLAEGVAVPAADAARGAAQARNVSGGPFDTNGPNGSLFNVRSSQSEPEGASVKVNYRGHWFYIADNDEDSKVTFALLSMLLMLQGGDSAKVTPLISLSAG